MSKEMNWDTFVPTREIREYDMKLRESIRQREQMKLELAELESRGKDMFYDVEHEMLETGIRYFDVRSEFYVYKVEYEYIKAEKEVLFEENFHTFVLSFGAIWRTIHIESVFALSLTENVAIFKKTRTTNSTHSCLDYAVRVSCTQQYLISIRVWGIASFIRLGFATTFS